MFIKFPNYRLQYRILEIIKNESFKVQDIPNPLFTTTNGSNAEAASHCREHDISALNFQFRKKNCSFKRIISVSPKRAGNLSN